MSDTGCSIRLAAPPSVPGPKPFDMLTQAANVVAQKQEYGKIEDNNNEEIREHCSTTDFFSTISNRLSNFLKHSWIMDFLVEYTGFEPVASTMRMLRAPSCANTPCQ